ncbi:MAG: hypothetical protein ICV70_07770 [Jiangellaceae bacterium]|nr:hypothetical protein [Jiangellaceae bacterium]
MSEQPDYDPDGTGLRDHAEGDVAPELDASALTDDLPEGSAPEDREAGTAGEGDLESS